MKNYSSKKAKRGRLAYRTPSRFLVQKAETTKRFAFPRKGK